LKVPDADGVPLIVIKLPAHAAVTPDGNPVGVPIPVAPVVPMVIFGESAVLMHSTGLDDGVPAVLLGLTVTEVVVVFEQVPFVKV
jgi:hypothetical protein